MNLRFELIDMVIRREFLSIIKKTRAKLHYTEIKK